MDMEVNTNYHDSNLICSKHRKLFIYPAFTVLPFSCDDAQQMFLQLTMGIQMMLPHRSEKNI